MLYYLTGRGWTVARRRAEADVTKGERAVGGGDDRERMAVGETVTCRDSSDCLWTYTATGDPSQDIDFMQLLRHARSGDCPVYPEHVEPGTALAGGKLAQALNRLATARMHARYGPDVRRYKSAASTTSFGWLLVFVLGDREDATAKQVSKLMSGWRTLDPGDRPERVSLLRHAFDRHGWSSPFDVEQVFKSVSRGEVVAADTTRRPWKWRVTDEGRALLAEGVALVLGGP
ncbi:hypothetical protein [Saccharothrix sp. HUAS TT1]|uniref:hypothetical protein n=1 Tax=unclassified Saccharothrix TaxID=2593673 RepID=UPI00345BE0AB